MNQTTNNIDKLEQQVDDLLGLCSKLTSENKNLRGQVKELSTERSALIEQKEKARHHVEAMISRLKSLENNQ